MPMTLRLTSRTPSGARQALTRIAEVLQGLGLRLSARKTKLVTVCQGVDFLGYWSGFGRKSGGSLAARRAGVSAWCCLDWTIMCEAGGSTSSGPRWRGCLTGTIAGSRGGCAPIWRSGGATGSGASTPTSGFGFTSDSPDCIICVGTSFVNSRPGVVPATVL
jgi:hypothetical protein